MKNKILSGGICATFWFLGVVAWAQTATLTPNLTLTPPCSPAGVLGNNAVGTSGTTSDYMRGSVYTLSSPATVYSLTVYCLNPPANMKLITGIYSGSAGSFGNLIVQSAAQTVVSGWNGFSITPTYLAAGTYWLAYLAEDTGYNATFSAGSGNIEAFTTTSIAFGNLPNTMPTPTYGTGKESIYSLYCDVPTNTPTVTDTPTITYTPTNTLTATATNTPTNTGTILTNTPTFTMTLTPTPTATQTVTLTPSITPNLSLTPSCGGSFASFGDSTTTGSTGYIAGAQLRACLYNLASDSTVETMSLYATSDSVGSVAEVALYTNNTSTMTVGNLVAQSVTQTLSAGWNVFQVPSSPVTAGDYWLTYVFSAPVSYELIYQETPSSSVTTVAYTSSVPSWTLNSRGSDYSLSYGTGWNEPILANYCPGLVTTNTPTSTATTTGTMTPTDTPTNTGTPTPSGTPTGTPTVTFTYSVTGTPTMTLSSTESMTSTDTSLATMTDTSTPTFIFTDTQTETPSETPANTLSNTPTDTPSDTDTSTATNTVFLTTTSTESGTSTNTSTVTMTLTPTNTPTLTDTPMESDTSTPTMIFTNTSTPSLTVSNTLTNTPTNTATFTPTTLITVTATATLTETMTLTALSSTTNTVTGTFTMTPTNTVLSVLTSTPTQTFTPAPSQTNQLSMFPNPLQGNEGLNLQIAFDQPHDYVIVNVYTVAFRKIYGNRLNNVPAGLWTYNIVPSAFRGGGIIANGLYYVTVTTPSNHWLSKLLVLR